VADGPIDVTERQLYTFTNKFGDNKFVPVNHAHLAKPPIRTYSKKSDPCKNKTKKKTKAINTINTILNTTRQIKECKSNKNETTSIATVEVPITTVEVPVNPVAVSIPTLESSFPMDFQQSTASQVQVPMDDASQLFFGSDQFVVDLIGREVEEIEKQNQQYFSDDGYSGSVSGNSSPTSSAGDYAILHNMETGEELATNTVPELHLPEVNFHLDPVMVTGDIEFDLLDSNFVLEKGQDWLPEGNSVLLGTFENVPDLLNAFSSENPNITKEQPTTSKEQPTTKKVIKRHTKGPKRQNLEDLPEKNRDNVERCREYRKIKKEKKMDEIDELNALETKNKELQLKEQRMKDELVRMQGTYLKLISEGRVKFS